MVVADVWGIFTKYISFKLSEGCLKLPKIGNLLVLMHFFNNSISSSLNVLNFFPILPDKGKLFGILRFLLSFIPFISDSDNIVPKKGLRLLILLS